MIRNQASRTWPVTPGGLATRELTTRLLLIPFVIAASATLVAAGLFPAVGSAGKAIKNVENHFLGNTNNPLQVAGFALRSTIYAADGSELATVADYNRVLVSLQDVPLVARLAVLAIEDHGFYKHGPINLTSILRAAIANAHAGRIVQGGSTITQQLVKNTETGNEETLARKIAEAQDAIRVERTYTKDQILELYLNEVYFGHGAYGIGTAAEYYFAEPIQKLTLPQAALLAGLISAPVSWDPIAHPESALARRNHVLDEMRQPTWISLEQTTQITQPQYADAVTTPITLSAKQRTVNKPGPQPYFVRYVEDQILHPVKDSPWYTQFLATFGSTYDERKQLLFQGGLRIYTTIKPNLQRYAENAVATHLPNPGNSPTNSNPEASLLTIAPNSGAIQAMYGGPDYRKHKINLAVQAGRQAGSSFKAFTLVAALQQGIPVGKVYDTPNPVKIDPAKCPDPSGQWTPSNSEPGNGGFINMATATADSINVYFAQLIADTGPENVVKAAKDMGVVSYAYNSNVSVPAVCAITLGSVQVNPLSMTAGYSTLADNGTRCYPFAISKVVSGNGKVLYRGKPSCKQMIDRRISAQVTDLLRGVISSGTGTRANIGRPEAGKTGTAQNFTDAWFMGYVPQLVTGVWVGYGYPNKEVSMVGAPALHGAHPFGGTVAAPIWHDFMAKAVAGLPVKDFPPPPPQKSGTVPNVVGMTQAAAEKTLSDANFTAVVQTGDSAEPAGTVFAQSPGGGASAPLGSRVTITVSNGHAPQVTVPNVIGEEKATAIKDLQALGLQVKELDQVVQDQNLVGKVLNQDPQGGTLRDVGSTVTIIVGVGPNPTPSPSPSPSPP